MRLLLSFAGALLVALILFALMVILVMPPRDEAEVDQELTRISFVRSVSDTASESRQRQPLEAPERPQPPEPVPQVQPVDAPQQPAPEVNLAIEIPSLPTSIQLSSAPTLEGLRAAEAAPAPAPPAAAPAPAASQGPRLSQEPTMLVEVKPDYPRRAQASGIEGRVVLAFTVTAEGRAENVRVIEADPPGLFEREARRAAVRSRYVPLRENGQPVASEVTKPFVFRMDGGR